jgi:hypothetical protein
MILPTTYGALAPVDFFIYAACDTGYFDEFGRELIASIHANAREHLHLHIFNPTSAQLDYCANQSNVSVTYEYAGPELFDAATSRWTAVPADELRKSQLDRTVNAMGKGNDINLHHRMQKTYYACARFIRLAELARNRRFMSMDVDALVRRPLPALGTGYDFYLHKITGRKARILAGGMYVHPQGRSQEFLDEYAQALKVSLQNDYIYWGLDQDVLDKIVPKYLSGHLPMSLIDWDMHPDSVIWTAKGTRKDSPKFVSEKRRYTS